MVTWGRAWRASGAYFGWSLVWGLIGIIFFGAGIAAIIGSQVNPLDINSYVSGIIGGIILMIIGYVIMILGAMASFFKISSEVTAEEVQRKVSQIMAPQPRAESVEPPVCPSCGSPLRWIEEYQRWYCDQEEIYV